MTKLHEFPNDTSKLLITPAGRYADCLCCCGGLPAALFIHMVPTYGDPAFNSDCFENDEGSQFSNGSGYNIDIQTDNNCEDWETANEAEGEAELGQCFAEGGAGTVGMEAQLH